LGDAEAEGRTKVRILKKHEMRVGRRLVVGLWIQRNELYIECIVVGRWIQRNELQSTQWWAGEYTIMNCRVHTLERPTRGTLFLINYFT
jgi:hypothetical protein